MLDLRIVIDQFDLPAEHAAQIVDLVDRQIHRGDHLLAVDIEAARRVVDAGDLDRIVGMEIADDERTGHGCGGPHGGWDWRSLRRLMFMWRPSF